jgi:hypothetical protein
MRRKRIEVIKIDEVDRIYLYPRKVLLRQKKNGKWVTKVCSPTLSGILESDLVSDDVKKKLEKMLKNKNSFLIGV